MGYPEVPLGTVVKHRKEFIEIDDTQTYKRCRVKLHAAGIVLRDEVSGSEIKTKRQQVCRADELLVAEIDAKHGGFGIVPAALEGAIVSSHYFLFEIDEAALDHSFLGHYIRTPAFRDQVAAQGSTNYAAIRPQNVLDYTMPLPPPWEQQRIVARVEELAAKVEEARGLRRTASTDVLIRAMNEAIIADSRWSRMPLGEIVTGSQNGLAPRPKNDPPGTRILRISAATSRPNGVVDETDYKYLELGNRQEDNFRLLPGDLLACRFNGNLAYVGRFAIFQGRSEEQYVYPDKLIRFRADPSHAISGYIRSAMNSPSVRTAIEEKCATTAGNIGISAGALKTIELPVPPLFEQRRIVAYLEDMQGKVDSLKRLQAETAAELEALMPSILDQAFRGAL